MTIAQKVIAQEPKNFDEIKQVIKREMILAGFDFSNECDKKRFTEIFDEVIIALSD